MITPKRDIGTRIEEVATTIGDQVCRIKDHQLEDWKLDQKLGFISDEEKLKSLKRCLYEAATARANPEHIQNLTRAIATISEQLETERKHRNTLSYHLYGILNSIILLATLGAFFSFPATWTCNVFKNQSQACQVSRIVPNSIFKFFSEPK